MQDMGNSTILVVLLTFCFHSVRLTLKGNYAQHTFLASVVFTIICNSSSES